MALLKLAGVWERFILKDLTTFAKYAKVELVPPGPGDLVGAVKGVGKLTGDALTFKWAQVCEYTPKLRWNRIILPNILFPGLYEAGRCEHSCRH